MKFATTNQQRKELTMHHASVSPDILELEPDFDESYLADDGDDDCEPEWWAIA